MLVELWERLRGYHKWIDAEATIESSEMHKTPVQTRDGVIYSYDASDLLVWTAKNGEKYGAAFSVPDDSPLYQLIDGEKVWIRYNPNQPDDFYYRDLLKTRIHTYVKHFIVATLFLAYFVLRLWVRLHRR